MTDTRKTPIRRCHGCGDPVAPGQTWCSSSCHSAEDGHDDYDLDYEEVA